jgi:site-specific recombinase XerD
MNSDSTSIISAPGGCLQLETGEADDDDDRVIALWLHGRGPETQRAYRADAKAFAAAVAKPLRLVTLGDVQAFADSLETSRLAAASRRRTLNGVKSLIAFAHRVGYLPFDVARPLRLPVLRDRLAERILSEVEVRQMLAHERHPRNLAILYLLYASGVRVSECCSLAWRDTQERSEGSGQITVLGKGGKTNAILLPASVWAALVALRDRAGDDAPVFKSRTGRHLHPTQVRRIVRAAARRAEVEKPVSPHWMRHAHASHALDRGAAIHLVQATLGHASVATTGKYLHARPSDSSSRYLAI